MTITKAKNMVKNMTSRKKFIIYRTILPLVAGIILANFFDFGFIEHPIRIVIALSLTIPVALIATILLGIFDCVKKQKNLTNPSKNTANLERL